MSRAIRFLRLSNCIQQDVWPPRGVLIKKKSNCAYKGGTNKLFDDCSIQGNSQGEFTLGGLQFVEADVKFNQGHKIVIFRLGARGFPDSPLTKERPWLN